MASSRSTARARKAGGARNPKIPETSAELASLQGWCVCGNLRMAARLVSAFYDAHLRPCGIEANQLMMLWVAQSGGGAMLAKELASAAGMDPSTASRNLVVLEDRGLIASRRAPEDRRRQHIALTRRGRAKLAQALPRWRAAQAELAAITADFVDVLGLGRQARRVARRLQASG